MSSAARKSRKVVGKQWSTISLLRVCLFLWVIFASSPLAASSPWDISYNGRFVDSTGRPLAGPLNFTIEFYDAKEGGNQKGSTFNYSAVTLIDGVFQVDVALAASDYEAIFSLGGETWIQITDATHKKTYSRQRYFAVPYALKVPVDNVAVGFNDAGQLTIKNNAAAGAELMMALNASSGTINSALMPALSGDVTGASGTNTVAKIQNKQVSANSPSLNDVLQWNGTAWTPSQVAGSGGGTVTSVGAFAPLSVANGNSTPALIISRSGSSVDGYLSSADWTSFNGKQSALSAAASSSNGFLASSDWITFNSKGAGSVTVIASGTGLAGGAITTSGTLSLATSGVTAGTYTRTNVTVDN